MPSRIVYIPLEPYKSRYTEYTSCVDGVYETAFRDEGIKFISIRPSGIVTNDASVYVPPGQRVEEAYDLRRGRVVDYLRRSEYSFAQMSQLLGMLSAGVLDPANDVIYFDDFWTPGFEMLPYSQSIQFGPSIDDHVPTYSFCFAQSTDPNDFTAPMTWWMRSMEKGWASAQKAVMCASREMVTQWLVGALPSNKLRWCGLPYDGRRVLAMAGLSILDVNTERHTRVVYSSRFDAEKNPWFLFKLAEAMPSVEFVVCSGLTWERFQETSSVPLESIPSNVVIKCELSKQQYFNVLRTAKVQFNCADQDFVSFTLLDATLNGCAPLYPNVLTFPDALNYQAKNLYDVPGYSVHAHPAKTLEGVVTKLESLLAGPVEDYSWVYKKYDHAVARMLSAMNFTLRSRPARMADLCGTTDLEELRSMLAAEEAE